MQMWPESRSCWSGAEQQAAQKAVAGLFRQMPQTLEAVAGATGRLLRRFTLALTTRNKSTTVKNQPLNG